MKRFVENRDGVHLYSPFFDFTLCGDTDDRDDAKNIDIEPMHPTKKRVVTCPKCIQIILQCRGVRIKAAEEREKVKAVRRKASSMLRMESYEETR